MDTPAEPIGMSSGYPADLGFEGPDEIARWRPLIHWLLVIPHLIIAGALNTVGNALTFISLFTILFTKQIPEGIFNLMVLNYRYRWRTTTYMFFMRESYPPFEFDMTQSDPGGDPATLSIERQDEYNRWLPLVKWLLAIPHYFVLFALFLATFFVMVGAFFSVLVMGEFPEGFRNFLVKVARYGTRVMAYVGLLRDEYPPFSFN